MTNFEREISAKCSFITYKLHFFINFTLNIASLLRIYEPSKSSSEQLQINKQIKKNFESKTKTKLKNNSCDNLLNTSKPTNIEFSAPGSCMLLGEHAVLHNEPAIVAAINKRIRVKLSTRSDDKINIISALGKYQININNITPKEPFMFVTHAILFLQNKLSYGFDLKIFAEFNATTGLGSSAAVVVATLAALYKLTNTKLNLKKLHLDAVKIINNVQGIGSAADAAASIYGGTIFYKYKPKITIEKLKHNPPISLIYSGYKTKTADVIKIVNAYAQKEPKKYLEIFHKIGTLVYAAKSFINNNNLLQLAKTFTANYQLQKKLKVSDPILNAIITATKNVPNILAAKISGSGLGDCIVTLGKLPKDYFMNNKISNSIKIQKFISSREEPITITQIQDIEITDQGLQDESL